MKFNLPKSKFGARIAVLYLTITGYFLYGVVFTDDGPHGTAGISFIYAFLLTLPLSGVLFSILSSISPPLKDYQPNKLLDLLFIGGLVFCALFNTVIIYLRVGFVSQMPGTVLGSSGAKNKMEGKL